MNLKKTGQLFLIATLVVLFGTSWMGIQGMWKLTFGAFGFGAAFVLIFFGGIQPPEE